MSAQPYPWSRIVTVPRESVGLLVDARRALASSLDETKIAEALSDLLGIRATVDVSSVGVATEDAAMPYGSSFVLATSDDGVRIRIDLDRQLARTLVARVVGRPSGLGDMQATTTPEIEGLFWRHRGCPKSARVGRIVATAWTRWVGAAARRTASFGTCIGHDRFRRVRSQHDRAGT